MVNLPPEQQNERRDRGAILSFDEMVAVALALLGVGAVLWWGNGPG
jgi:Tfp pilus assembly protein PilX